MADRLFLLEPGFADPAHPGARFVCPHSNAVEGLLASFPDRAAGLRIERLPFAKPRQPVADLLGPDNQSLPVLILDGAPASAEHVEQRDGLYFIASGTGILAHLAERHGFPRIHP